MLSMLTSEFLSQLIYLCPRESGFITNPEDAAGLKGKPGRRMIARSLFTHNYFIENPIQAPQNENKDY